MFKFFILLFIICIWSMQDLPAYATCGHCPGDSQSASTSSATGDSAAAPTTQSTAGLDSPTQQLSGAPTLPSVTTEVKTGSLDTNTMSKAIEDAYGGNNRGVNDQPNADGSITRTYTDSQNRCTRIEKISKLGKGEGSRITTDYNPDTGNKRSELETYANGHPKKDTRFDGRTGDRISETDYYDDGKTKSHKTWNPDGTYHSETREENGSFSIVDSTPGAGSKTLRYRPDGRLASIGETKGMQSSIRTLNERGDITSETHLEHGMVSSKTTHEQNTTTNTKFYPDGSVKSQTKTTADGKTTTSDYPAGKYFESDGEVRSDQGQ